MAKTKLLIAAFAIVLTALMTGYSCLAIRFAPANSATDLINQPLAVSWSDYGAAARNFVQQETTETALPYVPARSGDSDKLVIAHYFPPFPMSIDGGDPAHDYYETGYLDPAGEGGKHRDVGGYLRVRPLPAKLPRGYDYRRFNLAVEVARAARIGIDAFGINLLTINSDEPLWRTSLDLLDAARAVSLTFKIVPEPDMTSIGDRVTTEQLAAALEVFGRHAASYHTRDGRLLVMPFAAEAKSAVWWRDLQDRMVARGVPIALVPVFVDRARLPSFASFVAGASTWGDRYASAAVANTRSAQASRLLGIGKWIMPIAFQDYRPKDRMVSETRNSEGWRAQWQSALSTRSEGVHLVTWNDYSESTQVAPTRPGGFGIYDLTGYYIAWFKRGAPPPVVRDAIYLVYRHQLLRSDVGAGSPLRIDGPTALTNDIEAISILQSPATIRLQVGRSTEVSNAPAGFSAIRMKAVPGKPIVTLDRPGSLPIPFSRNVTIVERSATQDATYYGESLIRDGSRSGS